MANYKLTQTGAKVQSDLDVVENLVDAFSTQLTYSRGELVIYNSNLYVCHTAVSSAGSWTGSTNWTETDLETLLEGKQTLLSSGTNIKTINGNSVLGSGDLDTNSNLANTYSTSGTYSVGALVIYNHTLYRCTGSTSGSWDSSKWQSIKLKGLLDLKQDALDERDLNVITVASVIGFDNGGNLGVGAPTGVDNISIVNALPTTSNAQNNILYKLANDLYALTETEQVAPVISYLNGTLTAVVDYDAESIELYADNTLIDTISINGGNN